MKCILRIVVFLLVFISFGCASSKVKVYNDSLYTTILQDGIKRKVKIPKVDGKIIKSTNTQTGTDDTKFGVIVEFIDDSKVDISTFESKYGLKLKDKLVIGYYIFSNYSSVGDLELIQKILNNEKNIRTLKPNWKMGVVVK